MDLWCYIHNLLPALPPSPAPGTSEANLREAANFGAGDAVAWTLIPSLHLCLGTSRYSGKGGPLLQAAGDSPCPLLVRVSQQFVELSMHWRPRNRPSFHGIKYCEQKRNWASYIHLLKLIFGTYIPRTTSSARIVALLRGVTRNN